MKTVLLVFLSLAMASVACQQYASSGHQLVRQAASPSPSISVHNKQEWRAAMYRGLRMGKSTRAEMFRQLGKPQGSSPYDEGTKASGRLYEYKVGGELPGVLVVAVDDRTGLILNVQVEPESWSKEQAIRLFGPEYVVTRYGFDDCLGDGVSAPLYETHDGPITRIEYRERGIAIALKDENKVDSIMYVSEPVGAPSSRCKK